VPPPVEGSNVAPNVALGTAYSPWTLFSPGLTAGAGVNLVPTAQGQTIAVSAVGGGGAIKLIATGTALTAKVVSTPAVATGTYPLQQFDCGLTVGHTYFLNVTFDGGANTTWGASSSGSSLTATPFISNTLAGEEPQIPSLFGYGQLATSSAPVATTTLANGANPLIDYPPLSYTCYYDALDGNVYINTTLTNGGGSNQPVSSITWTEFANGWKVWISAVDLGLTPA
jgi:hypothetical protein